jgi:hypothetical protein
VDLSHVLWIGGGQGSGRSPVAKALSERFEVQLYVIDERDEAHEPRMPRMEAASDAQATLAELVDRFVTAARHRFRLVLEDLAALPASPLAIVEGAQLFPTSVAAVLRDPGHALFLLEERCATRFDELVAQRFAWEARDLRLKTLVADAPIEELIERAAAHFEPVLGRCGLGAE